MHIIPQGGSLHFSVLHIVASIVLAICYVFTICPGMSEKNHGSQENNKHDVAVSPDMFFVMSLGIHFELTASGANADERIKNNTHKKCGKWDGVLWKDEDDTPWIIKRRYFTHIPATQSRGVTYHLRLPTVRLQGQKRVRNEAGELNRDRKTLSLHRWNWIIFTNSGGDRISKSGRKFMGSCTTWEEKFLVTGGAQVDDDDRLVNKLREDYNLIGVDMPELLSKKVEDGIPQGQCDVDHCLHRHHWACNSIYHCYPMSHTANTCNSIIRRGVRDWCFLLSKHRYRNGK